MLAPKEMRLPRPPCLRVNPNKLLTFYFVKIITVETSVSLCRSEKRYHIPVGWGCWVGMCTQDQEMGKCVNGKDNDNVVTDNVVTPKSRDGTWVSSTVSGVSGPVLTRRGRSIASSSRVKEGRGASLKFLRVRQRRLNFFVSYCDLVTLI